MRANKRRSRRKWGLIGSGSKLKHDLQPANPIGFPGIRTCLMEKRPGVPQYPLASSLMHWRASAQNRCAAAVSDSLLRLQHGGLYEEKWEPSSVSCHVIFLQDLPTYHWSRLKTASRRPWFIQATQLVGKKHLRPFYTESTVWKVRSPI